MSSESVREAANELYWTTDLSVAAIAGKLELSKRAFYDLLDPIAAGRCAACGEAVVYANRQARDAREASCATCGQVAATAEPAPSSGVADANGQVLRGTPKTADAARRPVRRRASTSEVDGYGDAAPYIPGFDAGSRVKQARTFAMLGVGLLAAGALVWVAAQRARD